MAGQPAFEVGLRSFDADTGQLLRVLDQSIAERQATQLGAAPDLCGPRNVLLTDDFSSAATGWTDDAHQGAGAYAGGASHGYGYGIAIRSDGGGDVYAFLIEDHAVAIQKWTGGGARVSDSPDPVTTSAVHADGTDRLRAVCQTVSGGQAVHLEFWLNGKKLVDCTDHDHPYTQGYLGLYVESISDASSTAAAEFDNFSAARL
jgi:hypothetical protein